MVRDQVKCSPNPQLLAVKGPVVMGPVVMMRGIIVPGDPQPPTHFLPIEPHRSFLARLLDALRSGVQRPLALGLLRHLLVRLGSCCGDG